MSLQLAAQHLAQQGRGPDTTLVHMGQGEVEALQGLAAAHGGMLTTNPQTGLPEAGFLSKILPMVAGAALTPLTGGLINPLTASMLVGGVTGLATGNIKKGLLAGLGAYGGAGLAGSLGAAGAASGASGAANVGADVAANAGADVAATTAAEQAATSVTGQNGVGMLGSGVSKVAAPPLTGLGSGTYGIEQINAGTLGGVSPAAGTYGALGTGTSPLAPASFSAGATSSPAVYEAMAPMDKLYAIGRGATPENLMNYAANNKLATAAAFAPVIAGAMAPPKQKEIPEDTDPGTEYDFDPGTVSPTPDYDPQGRGQRYFNPRYTPRTTSRFARGGISDGLSSAESHLGSYSAGGRGRLLRGPGDGVSDSIPATIGGKQPARLADGEFVIPARIVSELGNGSTEAGAKQLYAMMDRIQRARRKTTGKQQVAKNTKAHKLMPA